MIIMKRRSTRKWDHSGQRHRELVARMGFIRLHRPVHNPSHQRDYVHSALQNHHPRKHRQHVLGNELDRVIVRDHDRKHVEEPGSITRDLLVVVLVEAFIEKGQMEDSVHPVKEKVVAHQTKPNLQNEFESGEIYAEGAESRSYLKPKK